MLGSNNPRFNVPLVVGVTRFRLNLGVQNNLGMKNTFSVTGGTQPTIAVGFSVDRIWLELSTRQTQFLRLRVTVGGVDLSEFIVGSVQVDWPEDAGGSGNVVFAGKNPLLDTTINTEKEIIIDATLSDPITGESSTVRVFTGRIVQWDFDPDTGLTSCSLQDMSRDVSHESDRLNREILGVDPISTETVTASSNVLRLSRDMDTGNPQPVLGIWEESDTARKRNLVDRGNFIIPDSRTIEYLDGGLINGGVNYVVRYIVPLTQFDVPRLTKSAVLRIIANLAGIAVMINERQGFVEDEVVNVNITANDELPLDLMRKISVPQTWKIEYNEHGNLIVRREILKATADFDLNGNHILENTFRISKDIDPVINEIRVAGIKKRLGTSGGFL